MEWLLMLASALLAILSAIAMFRFGHKKFIAWELLFGAPLFAIGGIILGSIGLATDKPSLIFSSIASFLGSAVLMSIPSIKTYRHRHDAKKYRSPTVSKPRKLARVIDFPQNGDKDSSE